MRAGHGSKNAVAGNYGPIWAKRGRVNTSRKGRRREHQSRALLEAQGYVVIRSAASLGRFDLVAVGPADILLIQVKANRWPSADELAELRAFPTPANCRRLVHRWRDRQASPDVREL